ncbi:hypothetical protein PUN28_001275 [Cardiocondyla obscurior]|uniref:Uncharacterized protein n=1 Tax=Cardiocondyla obscurior TaxID=286306 RepID=A0AAW2H492_9HYME
MKERERKKERKKERDLKRKEKNEKNESLFSRPTSTLRASGVTGTAAVVKICRQHYRRRSFLDGTSYFSLLTELRPTVVPQLRSVHRLFFRRTPRVHLLLQFFADRNRALSISRRPR